MKETSGVKIPCAQCGKEMVFDGDDIDEDIIEGPIFCSEECAYPAGAPNETY